MDARPREAGMRERTQAEIEAALTAYHGADGWDHNDRADMRAALAAADAVAPNTARIEALEAAGNRLADAAVRLDADDITSALAAWRAADGGGDA